MHIAQNIPKSADHRRIPFEYPILVAHQPEFLPWLGFISKAAMGDVVILLDSVDFRKEYFQNRNKIRTFSEKGWQWLTVPVVGAKKHVYKISDARIDSGKWEKKHLMSIEQAYSKTKYFALIFPRLKQIYDSRPDGLSDFNQSIILFAYEMFNIDIPILRTSDMLTSNYDIHGRKTDIVISMCRSVGAKTFVAGQFGKDYLEREKFEKHNIRLVFQSFEHPVYEQLHGDFIPNMAFIDLLFNHGPGAISILGKSGCEQS